MLLQWDSKWGKYNLGKTFAPFGTNIIYGSMVLMKFSKLIRIMNIYFIILGTKLYEFYQVKTNHKILTRDLMWDFIFKR